MVYLRGVFGLKQVTDRDTILQHIEGINTNECVTRKSKLCLQDQRVTNEKLLQQRENPRITRQRKERAIAVQEKVIEQEYAKISQRPIFVVPYSEMNGPKVSQITLQRQFTYNNKTALDGNCKTAIVYTSDSGISGPCTDLLFTSIRLGPYSPDDVNLQGARLLGTLHIESGFSGKVTFDSVRADNLVIEDDVSISYSTIQGAQWNTQCIASESLANELSRYCATHTNFDFMEGL